MRTLSDILYSVEDSRGKIKFVALDTIDDVKNHYNDFDIEDLLSEISTNMETIINLCEDIKKELE